MTKRTYRFSSAPVEVYFDAKFRQLEKLVDKKKGIIITDENIFSAHHSKFKNWNVITLKPGEQFKIQATADTVIEQLIGLEADRQSVLIGVGGGVVTDLTGYVASIYMRGIRFGFVPTSLLAMVDASIGGKNGIDVGEYKNMVGIIRQPSFLFYDSSLLSTLPDKEWSNGFAEIIKHACILDRPMFKLLESTSLDKLRKKKPLLDDIIRRNVHLKSGVVKRDEFEQGDRKLLNFGHTLGHALETQYELTHGQAVALGMIFAGWLSAKLLGYKDLMRLEKTIATYGLPTRASFDVEKVFNVLKMDKKRVSKTMNYILLSRTGKGEIVQIPVEDLRVYLTEFNALKY
ncbi:MAG: 3-dehydroquinate synthase [Bacteroidota bacterium]|jgi:3-dehydroquinate synthase